MQVLYADPVTRNINPDCSRFAVKTPSFDELNTRLNTLQTNLFRAFSTPTQPGLDDAKKQIVQFIGEIKKHHDPLVVAFAELLEPLNPPSISALEAGNRLSRCADLIQADWKKTDGSQTVVTGFCTTLKRALSMDITPDQFAFGTFITTMLKQKQPLQGVMAILNHMYGLTKKKYGEHSRENFVFGLFLLASGSVFSLNLQP